MIWQIISCLPCLGKHWHLPRCLTVYLFSFKGKSKPCTSGETDSESAPFAFHIPFDGLPWDQSRNHIWFAKQPWLFSPRFEKIFLLAHLIHATSAAIAQSAPSMDETFTCRFTINQNIHGSPHQRGKSFWGMHFSVRNTRTCLLANQNDIVPICTLSNLIVMLSY